jgi:hypothetical protein
MPETVIVIPGTDLTPLAAVRTFPGLKAAVAGDQLWVRGLPVNDLPLALKQLPALHTYFLDDEQRLYESGHLTPVATLPRLPWKELTALLPVTLPVSAMPGALPPAYTIQLKRTPTGEAAALLTTLDVWKQYAADAPMARLEKLLFAVSARGETLILGEPLPPIPGKGYTLEHDILLPAGYHFDPPAIAPLVAQQLNPNKELLLFHADARWEIIPRAAFVSATRSAVRLTDITYE